MWVLSLTWGQICRLKLLVVLASAVIFGSESYGNLNYISLSLIQGFPFCRLSGLQWRYSTPLPHGIAASVILGISWFSRAHGLTHKKTTSSIVVWRFCWRYHVITTSSVHWRAGCCLAMENVLLFRARNSCEALRRASFYWPLHFGHRVFIEPLPSNALSESVTLFVSGKPIFSSERTVTARVQLKKNHKDFWSWVSRGLTPRRTDCKVTLTLSLVSWKSVCEGKTRRLVWNGRQPGS
jgi:hypothetical protein